jgi:hypothetical protein
MGQSSSMSREQVLVQAKDWPASRIGRKPVHLQDERKVAWGLQRYGCEKAGSFQNRDKTSRNPRKVFAETLCSFSE